MLSASSLRRQRTGRRLTRRPARYTLSTLAIARAQIVTSQNLNSRCRRCLIDLWTTTILVSLFHQSSPMRAAGSRGSSQSLRRRLLSGAKSYGPVCMSDSPVVVELLASAGYGHLVIDHEHGPTDTSSGQVLLQAVDAARGRQSHSLHMASQQSYPTEPIIRVPGRCRCGCGLRTATAKQF